MFCMGHIPHITETMRSASQNRPVFPVASTATASLAFTVRANTCKSGRAHSRNRRCPSSRSVQTVQQFRCRSTPRYRFIVPSPALDDEVDVLVGGHHTPIQGARRSASPYGGASVTGLTNLLDEVAASWHRSSLQPVYFIRLGMKYDPRRASFIPSPCWFWTRPYPWECIQCWSSRVGRTI